MNNKLKIEGLEENRMSIKHAGTYIEIYSLNDSSYPLISIQKIFIQALYIKFRQNGVSITGDARITINLIETNTPYNIELSGNLSGNIIGREYTANVSVYDNCSIDFSYFSNKSVLFVYDNAKVVSKAPFSKINAYDSSQIIIYTHFQEAELFDSSTLTTRNTFDKVTAYNDSLIKTARLIEIPQERIILKDNAQHYNVN